MKLRCFAPLAAKNNKSSNTSEVNVSPIPSCLSRFPVGMLPDGQWHQVSVGVSSSWLALYVDCELVERVNWTYPGQDITTDGLLMLGGIIEGFETPFEVRVLKFHIINSNLNIFLFLMISSTRYVQREGACHLMAVERS
jgi:hypothetical protein